MRKLQFRDDNEAIERLIRADEAIKDYSSSHPDELNEDEHKEFRGLLKDRADALSEATGLEIHSLFD